MLPQSHAHDSHLRSSQFAAWIVNTAFLAMCFSAAAILASIVLVMIVVI
jgi:hypothetical protein